MNEVIARRGLPLITNMYDVSSMLYAVGKTAEFLRDDRP
jgi:hypothetical protein